jgi:hypothetical protein
MKDELRAGAVAEDGEHGRQIIRDVRSRVHGFVASFQDRTEGQIQDGRITGRVDCFMHSLEHQRGIKPLSRRYECRILSIELLVQRLVAEVRVELTEAGL